MGNCKEVVEDIKKHLANQGLPAEVRVIECSEMGDGTVLRIDLDVSTHINGACDNPKEHHKSIKDRVLDALIGLEGEFDLAEAFEGREGITEETSKNIEDAKELWDKLIGTVKKWR